MRILHLDTGREMRGGQHQALALLAGLRELQIDALLLAPPDAPLSAAARNASLACEPLTMMRVWSESARAALVHAHDARAHSIAALCGRTPLVVSRRVDFPVRAGLLSRWKYSRPALFLAVSETVANRLLRAGVSPDKVQVVPDGVDVPAEAGTLDGPVVAIDSADPGKGRELIKRTGLPIHFTNDLPGMLPTARALVYISESEGLGSAALLAMAHGVPVVASRAGGLREIVIPGRTGLLVDNHAHSILTAVNMLLHDRTYAAQLGLAGRALVIQRFTRRHMIDGTIDAYRKALA